MPARLNGELVDSRETIKIPSFGPHPVSCLEAQSSVGHRYNFAVRRLLDEGIILMEKSSLFIMCMWPSLRHKAQIMTGTKGWQRTSSAKNISHLPMCIASDSSRQLHTIKWKTGVLSAFN